MSQRNGRRPVHGRAAHRGRAATRRTIPLAAAILASLLGAYTLLAQAPAAPATRVVQGQVFDAGTGAPLRRVRVRLSADRGSTATVFTNDEGRFAFDQAPLAALTVRAGKAGYTLDTAAVPPDTGAAGLALTLTRAAAIEGRVRNVFGGPASGVYVAAARVSADGDPPPAAPGRFSVQTDNLGAYRLGGLPPGKYEIAALSVPSGVSMTNATRDSVLFESRAALGAAGDPLVIALSPGDDRWIDFTIDGDAGSCRQSATVARPSDQSGTSAIRGRVTNALGEPLACTTVSLVNLPAPVPQVSTDPQGWYSLEGLAEGSYAVSARRPGHETQMYGQGQLGNDETPIVLRAGERRTEVDFVLRPNPAISGTVVDEYGEPIQGVSVEAWQLYRREGRIGMASPMDGPPIVTDDRGRYQLAKPPGTYLVAADGGGSVPASGDEGPLVYMLTYYPGTFDTSAAQRVEVAPGRDLHGIDIVLVPSRAATVTGTVLDAAGRPFAGTISLYTSDRSGAVAAASRTASPDASGRFTIRDVPPGDYVVKAIQLAGGGRQFGMQYVTVVDANPPSLDIRATEGAVVVGRVVLDGAAAGDDLDISVSASPTDYDLTPVSIPSNGIQMPSSHLDDGTFRLLGVTGPSRLLVATPRCEGCYVKRAVINGADAADRPFDFGLDGGIYPDAEIVVSSAGGLIEGRVEGEREGAVASFTVTVFSTNRDLWHPRSSHVRTASVRNGQSFRFAGLPPGEYFVAAYALPGPVDGECTEAGSPALHERLAPRALRVLLSEGEQRTMILRPVRM
jgi:protocatechuate 3,4-dioxygenase beta subunit